MFDKLSKFRTQVVSIGRDQQGAIAVIVALLIPVLAGGLALAIDLSRAANLQTELQDHADAIAISGATQLDQSEGSRARAIQAAAGALALVANTQRFGDTPEPSVAGGIAVDSTVNVPVDGVAVNQDIRFYVDLENKVQATTDATANFIEVTIQPRRVGYFFAGLVSQITEANPTARAVAGFDQYVCGIQPMMICNPNGVLEFDVMDHIGEGLFLKVPAGAFGGGGGGAEDFIAGEFGYLQVTGGSQNQVICNALGSVNPTPICLGPGLDGKGGNITSLHACVNARFGMYEGGGGLTAGWKNDADYQPDAMVLKGLIHDGSGQCDFNPVGIGGGAWNRPNEIPVPRYEGPGSDLTGVTTMSYPRDDCAYPGYAGPSPSCDLDNGGTQIGDAVWDMEAYATMEHGQTAAGLTALVMAINPLALADGLITRMEVYNYERSVLPLETTFPASADAYPSLLPACWTGGANLPMAPMPLLGSRRVISVAVVNCPDAAPNKKNLPTADPSGAIDIFLLEPIGGYSSNVLYAEIVGPAGSENLTVTAANRVVLYE